MAPAAHLVTQQVSFQGTTAETRFKDNYKTLALYPTWGRVLVTQTQVVAVTWDQVILEFASYFRATVSNS